MYGYYTIREILKLVAKKGVKRSSFPKKGLRWKGKVKDYPGAANIARGMTKKQKPKLRIV